MATRVARNIVNFDLTAANDPLTTSVDAGTGTNRGLVAWVHWRSNSNHVFASNAATYNGVEMTQIVPPMQTGTQFRLQMWALDAPTTGTNTLSITPNGGTALSAGLANVGVVSLEDVDMSTFLSNLATLLVSGSNNAFPLTETTVSETLSSEDGSFIYFVSVIRESGANGARTVAAGDIVTTPQQTFLNGLYNSHADGIATSTSSTPSVVWSSSVGTAAVERHIVLSIPSVGEPPAPPPTEGSPLRLGIGIGGSPLILTTQGGGSPLIIRPNSTVIQSLSDTPNIPVGYTSIVDQQFDSLLFTDSGVTWLNGAGYPTPTEGTVEITTEAGAPKSPSNVLRWTYPVGFDSNNAPGYRECVFGESYSSLYTAFWFRPSTTWEDHISGVNKLFYWTAENTPEFTGTSFVSLFFNNTAAPTAFRFVTQNPGEGQVLYTTSGFTPTLGEWHRIEVLQERTSGINGRVRIWCAKESAPNAVLALDETGVQLTDTGETTVQWVGVVANPYWGGNADVATQEFTLDFDHLTIVGIPV